MGALVLWAASLPDIFNLGPGRESPLPFCCKAQYGGFQAGMRVFCKSLQQVGEPTHKGIHLRTSSCAVVQTPRKRVDPFCVRRGLFT